MSAPSDAERAREIVYGGGKFAANYDHDLTASYAEMLTEDIAAALSAARAEGRAEGRAEEREACARIADDYEKDSCGNDCMGGCADCAWFTARREIAAAIRGRKP